MSQKPSAALHYVKGILWKPEGVESRLHDPQPATSDDPLVLLLRRYESHYRPYNDGDLPGGGVHVGKETGEAALFREILTETGIGRASIGEPRLVFANVIDDWRIGTGPVNVVHDVYVAQVALDAEVSREPFMRPEADNHSAEWVLLSRAIGETSIATQRDAMQWVYDRGLWQMAAAPGAQ
ncbi:MAG TPA: NUDIX hydrolase [Patescibacteria group bacterium]|nr:NUDIX hydrolase [Patescibacteria group bacterium]